MLKKTGFFAPNENSIFVAISIYKMNFLPEKIQDYIDEHSDEETALLYELNRKSHLELLHPEMVSGNIQGQFLRMISQMMQPQRILEVGTFTGYATICLADGLSEGGLIHTIDINEEIKDITTKYFEKAGISNKVKMHIGDALKIIPNLNETFDLIFLDADKANYPIYYPILKQKLKKGGFILADNVLWYGKILKPVVPKDKATKGVLAFNKLVKEDKEVEKFILSLRDGITMIRKK